MGCTSALLCEDGKLPILVFHNVTSKDYSAFIFPVFLIHLRIFEVAEVHELSKVDFTSMFMSLRHNFLFRFNFGDIPGNFSL